MRLLTRTSRPFPIMEPIPTLTPRVAAIRLLREKIDAGEAGLDPYMPSDLIVVAHENERVWVNRCCDLTGAILLRVPLRNGGERFRFVPEVDVRMELGLSGPNPAFMHSEVAVAASLLQAMTERALARERCMSEPVSLSAIRAARTAYDRRYPHGAEPQLVIRTDTEGPVAS